jgi:hypothetical protein
MTFEQAMTTSRPQFTQVLNSMSHDGLISLLAEFEANLDQRQAVEFDHKFAHENNDYKAVLLGKLTFLYFILKPIPVQSM